MRIVINTTFQFDNGALEKFEEAIWKSMDFLEASGHQHLADVSIDENEVCTHGVHIRRDSESILTRWLPADHTCAI